MYCNRTFRCRVFYLSTVHAQEDLLIWVLEIQENSNDTLIEQSTTFVFICSKQSSMLIGLFKDIVNKQGMKHQEILELYII